MSRSGEAGHCQPAYRSRFTFIFSELKSAVTVNDGDYVPDALTVEVQIQLIQCRSTEEALRTLL